MNPPRFIVLIDAFEMNLEVQHIPLDPEKPFVVVDHAGKPRTLHRHATLGEALHALSMLLLMNEREKP